MIGLAIVAITAAVAAPSPAAARPRSTHHGGAGRRAGALLLTKHQNRSICEHALHRWGSVGVDNDTVEGPRLLPGGIFLIGCSPASSWRAEYLVAYDLVHRRVIWVKPLEYGARYGSTDRYLLKISEQVKPAHGLRGREVHHSIVAFSMATGKASWHTRYPDHGETDTHLYPMEAPVEGLGGGPGAPKIVVLDFLGLSAFDVKTGSLVWSVANVPYSEASYDGAGMVVVWGRESNESNEISGFNPAIGTISWDLHLPQSCPTVSAETIDTVEWEYGNGCIVAYDLVTGQLVTSRWFPSPGRLVAINSNGILAWGDKHLSYYALAEPEAPVWAEPASESLPLALGAKSALVETRNNEYIVSLSGGKIMAKAPPGWMSPFSPVEPIEGPVDGIVATTYEGSYSTAMRMESP